MKTLFKTTALSLATMAMMGSSWAADHTMRISHQFPPTHPTPILLEQFARDVNEETDGKVEVKLYGGAQLLKPNRQHAAVSGGEIEAAIISAIQWGSSLPEMAVTQRPFLMSSIDAQETF